MPDIRQRSWFGRNWKWLVPFGCLGSLLTAAACAAVIFWVVMGFLQSSWAYTEGVNLAMHDQQVIDQLGQPIEASRIPFGSIDVSGSSGNADVSIGLTGAKNKGTLHIVARKQDDQWEFVRAEVEVNGQEQKINLLSDMAESK
jgi:hypothetical protein